MVGARTLPWGLAAASSISRCRQERGRDGGGGLSAKLVYLEMTPANWHDGGTGSHRGTGSAQPRRRRDRINLSQRGNRWPRNDAMGQFLPRHLAERAAALPHKAAAPTVRCGGGYGQWRTPGLFGEI